MDKQELAEERRATEQELAEERRRIEQELAEERRGIELDRRKLAEERQRIEKELAKERRGIELDRRKLAEERTGFELRKELEQKRLSEERRLFQMKWKILENELRRLARDKQEIEAEKERYFHDADSRWGRTFTDHAPEAEIFFSGVDSELALKKRYKELIKIYHPDNLAGDTKTLQMINRIYDSLKKQFTA